MSAGLGLPIDKMCSSHVCDDANGTNRRKKNVCSLLLHAASFANVRPKDSSAIWAQALHCALDKDGTIS